MITDNNKVKLEAVAQEIFGMTSRQYRKHAIEDGAPSVIRGKIDILQACKWLISYYRALAKGQGSVSLTDERTRLTKITADRKELQLEEEKGELINTMEAMEAWGMVCQAIRSKVLSTPSKLAPLILGIKTISEIKEITEKFMREVLTEIANPDLIKIAKMASDKGDVKHIKSSATSKGKRVGRPRKSVKPRKLRRAREVVQ